MKKQILSIAVLTVVASSVVVGQDSNYSNQPEFPTILLQPEDQLVRIGSNAVFVVDATNGPLAYQWFHNGSALNGQTNATIVIPNAQVSDVGFYSCNVIKITDEEAVPTRFASLMVFTNSINPQTGVDPVVVFSFPVFGNGSQGSCPGKYAGYVNYTKTAQQGWGWTPDTSNSNTVFTATDTNRTDTKIQYYGIYGDNGCNQTSVSVLDPPVSPVYRFTIYFTNNVPTNAYPITLDGFLP